MKDIVLNKYVRMFELLDMEAKLKLLTQLTENINKTFKKPEKDKNELLEALCGSWKDIGYYLQTSSRTYEYQDTAKCYIGFRNVMTYLGRAKGDDI